MVRGRIETTPSEQLVALRKARDRYIAMAEQLRDNSSTVPTRLEDHQRERDARRIASAYDKSIANMAAKMVRAGTSSRAASFFNNLGVARPVFAFAVGLLALVALVYPGLFENLRANVKAPTHIASPARPEVTSAALNPNSNTGNSSAPRSAVLAPPHAPTTLRPTAVDEPARPMARPLTPVRMTNRSKRDADDGFVAKVLQPDGTFKEEYFTSMPR